MLLIIKCHLITCNNWFIKFKLSHYMRHIFILYMNVLLLCTYLEYFRIAEMKVERIFKIQISHISLLEIHTFI